jgi:deoxyribonuclease-4
VTREGWLETIAEFDRTVGLSRLAAIHVNDSKKPRGSRVDRHEHIGKGTIGRRGFRNVMTDPRLAAIPKFLETPKDEDTLEQDRRNLAVLRRLATLSPSGSGGARGALPRRQKVPAATAGRVSREASGRQG